MSRCQIVAYFSLLLWLGQCSGASPPGPCYENKTKQTNSPIEGYQQPYTSFDTVHATPINVRTAHTPINQVELPKNWNKTICGQKYIKLVCVQQEENSSLKWQQQAVNMGNGK